MKNFKEFPKRYYTEFGIYFTTSNVDGRFAFFKEKIFCDLMIEELKLVKEIYKCKIFGFVINYDHCHFLIQHADTKERNISNVMKSLKRNFSRDVNKILGYSPIHPVTANIDSPLPGGGASQDPPQVLDSPLPGNSSLVEKNPHSSLPEKEKKKSILNPLVIDRRKKFVKKYGSNMIIFPKFKWQKSFHDHRIRDEDDLADALEYIDINPARHSIVKTGELYKYCSTHYKYDFIDELPF